MTVYALFRSGLVAIPPTGGRTGGSLLKLVLQLEPN